MSNKIFYIPLHSIIFNINILKAKKRIMFIGLTYDLRSYYLAKGYTTEEVAEFDCEETIDAIEAVLVSMGHQTEKIGCLQYLIDKLHAGKRWDFVFNIAEGMNGIGREAQIPALLDAYNIPYTFSSTEVLALALDKGLTNAVMHTYGVRTADFHVVRKISDIKKVRIPFPLFVKPIAEGTSRGVDRNSKVESYEMLESKCKFILDNFNQPALVEEFLPGREFTVGILGTGDTAKVIGVMEITFTSKAKETSAYTYSNKKLYEDYTEYSIVHEPRVASLALKAWQSLYCRGAGRVDVRMNASGHPCFIEVNPMAGLNPVYSDLCILCNKVGLPYTTLIECIVNDVISRIQK